MGERDDAVLLRFSSPVSGTDGQLGKLADAVIEPATLRVTHIVVRPHRFARPPAHARLVPFALVRGGDGRGAISLECTRAGFESLDAVDQAAYVPIGETIEPGEGWDVGVADPVPINPGGAGGLGSLSGEAVPVEYASFFSYDRVPEGEAEVRSISLVTSSDGVDLGGVDALRTDERGAVTHIVLSQRRLWRKRRIPIPVSAVKSIDTGEISMTLTAREAERLADRGALAS
jgi:sporulation protein YlmC with PRC-barrel domain